MKCSRRSFPMISLALLLGVVVLIAPASGLAQERGTPFGEWRYWGGDAWSTRYSPLDQINAANFDDLEIAWVWRGDNFGPSVDNILRATPIYVDGVLYSVAGSRRTVVALDPATGETLWTFREPHTPRWEASPRQNYGKGVAYHEMDDGRGVIMYVSPAFFLWALDAETGRPLENWGTPAPIPGFGGSGYVDLLADLGYDYDPIDGIPEERGSITSSSPAIVVDGMVVVGNSGLNGYYQIRKEDIAGHILAYDANTGKHAWRFNVIPGPGEFGHETWENDAWRYVGNISSWAPLSADLENGIVYIPTDPPTNDYYGGFHPGDNLFSTSVVALNARTGERVWHFQTVRHDIWNYDNPTAPILLDITVDGIDIPAVIQTTKQGYAYTFNRITGEPVWPIVDTPVPQSTVPGEQTSPTQPIPSKPAPFEMVGVTVDDLIDFTPELRQMAVEATREIKFGPAFNPPIHIGNDEGYRGSAHCPGPNGGMNILGGAVADPETRVMYVPSINSCGVARLTPGSEVPGSNVDWLHRGPPFPLPAVGGLPALKPPYGRITAIDMDTGEHLWWIPNGDTPASVRNNPRLAGLDIPITGKSAHATAVVTSSLLMFGEGRGADPLFHAVDKRTGEAIGSIELPAPTNTAPMTFMHEGRQYIVMAVGGGRFPGSLVALALPRNLIQ